MELNRPKFSGPSRNSQLLIVLITFFFLSPFIEEIHTRFRVISVLFLLIVLFSLRLIDLSPKQRATCFGLAGLVFMLEVVRAVFVHATLSDVLTIITAAFFVLFLTLAIALITQRMFSTTEVSVDTIMGGINLYLMIGYLWAAIYHLIYYFDKSAFYTSTHWKDTYLIYLSFTTLTTLGFGDVYPINKLAMVCANFEAVSGQMYLSIFVARMVGLHIIRNQSKNIKCPLQP